MTQPLKALDQLGLRRDLQGRRHLIHHPDKSLMCGLDGIEKLLVEQQTALLRQTIKRQQRLAQIVHLRQIGHLRAAAQCGQLIEQSGEFLTLGGMVAPAAQQCLGIEQNIHAFGQEAGDHAGVTRFALVILGA